MPGARFLLLANATAILMQSVLALFGEGVQLAGGVALLCSAVSLFLMSVYSDLGRA